MTENQFDCISRYFGSIWNFLIFPPRKWTPAHFSPFQINTQLLFLKFVLQNNPAAILDDRKSLSIAFLDISDQYTFFSQKGRRQPFWMTENHFRLHFSPFQINMHFFLILHKMAAGGNFGWPKIAFDCISPHFRWIRNFYFFSLGHQWLCQIWIWYAHWCRSYVKHKPWCAAADVDAAATSTQNHNIPEISNFGDIIMKIPFQPPTRTQLHNEIAACF